jgi:hypothetical protein
MFLDNSALCAKKHARSDGASDYRHKQMHYLRKYFSLEWSKKGPDGGWQSLAEVRSGVARTLTYCSQYISPHTPHLPKRSAFVSVSLSLRVSKSGTSAACLEHDYV